MSFIDPRQTYTYFNSNYSLKKTSKGWHTFKCPLCDELENRRKAAVNFQYGVVKCWICGYQNTVVDFVSETEGVSYNEARTVLRECTPSAINLTEIEDTSFKEYSAIELPYGFKPLLEGKGVMGDRARTYLKSRGFDLRDLDRMGVGYCSEEVPEDLKSTQEDYFGYIIIPFKSRGKMMYYIGRDFIGNFLRYKNPSKEAFNVGKGDILFNEDALYLYDEVFVLEGSWDAITVGRDAIATLGWSLSATQKSKIIQSDAEIITFVPDAGNDGRGTSFYLLALELALEISNHKRVRVVNLNGAEGKDVNAMGKAAFMEIYGSTPILTASEIMMQILNYDE